MRVLARSRRVCARCLQDGARFGRPVDPDGGLGLLLGPRQTLVGDLDLAQLGTQLACALQLDVQLADRLLVFCLTCQARGSVDDAALADIGVDDPNPSGTDRSLLDLVRGRQSAGLHDRDQAVHLAVVFMSTQLDPDVDDGGDVQMTDARAVVAEQLGRDRGDAFLLDEEQRSTSPWRPGPGCDRPSR